MANIGNKLFGVDCAQFGKTYAEQLLVNAQTQLGDLPGLKKNSGYCALTDDKKTQVRERICAHACNVLVGAGYSPETVNRVVRK